MTPVPLTLQHLYMFLASCSIHLTYFHLIKTFVPSIGKDRRKLSWILTLTTALIVSILGPYSTFNNLRTIFSDPIPYEMYVNPNSINLDSVQGHQIQRYDISFQYSVNPSMPWQAQNATTMWESNSGEIDMSATDSITRKIAFYKAYDSIYESSPSIRHRLGHSRLFFDLRYTPTDSPLTQAVLIFFMCYLLLDLACGTLYYREHISILAGWFHHTMYTGIIYYTVVTGNSHTATSFLIIEVPTFIMGLGFLHKPLRNDMLFGASYFLFRVLFDFTLSHEMIMNRPDMATAAKIMVLFKFLMNFKFFIDWIKQQIRLRRQRASVRAEKLCETTGVRTTEVVLVGHDILLSLPASSIAPKLSVSSKVGNEITSLVYQPQQKTMRQQSKQRKSQSSQKAKRRSSNDMPAAATPDAPFPILSPSKPRYGIRNRSTRTRTGGMMNDQPFVDMIAAY